MTCYPCAGSELLFCAKSMSCYSSCQHSPACLAGHVDGDTPRLLINKEKVTGGGGLLGMLSGLGSGDSLDFGPNNYRDAMYLGDCDEGIWALTKLLNWEGELQGLMDKATVVDWEQDVGGLHKASL